MIIANHNFFGKKVVLPRMQNTHNSIKLFVIGGVVYVIILEFISELGYEVSLLEKHDPNTYIG